jgi:DNA-binding CsgD family transcriptional regulator
MRARLLVGVIGVMTILANLLFGVHWALAVAAGLAVLVVGEVVGRFRRSPALPGAAAAAEPPPLAGRAHPLSPRELEVAVLIARGLTSKEVGARLEIKKGTVDKTLEHIKDKLGINSRPELAIWLMERGLLQPSGTAS